MTQDIVSLGRCLFLKRMHVLLFSGGIFHKMSFRSSWFMLSFSISLLNFLCSYASSYWERSVEVSNCHSDFPFSLSSIKFLFHKFESLLLYRNKFRILTPSWWIDIMCFCIPGTFCSEANSIVNIAIQAFLDWCLHGIFLSILLLLTYLYH